MPQLRLHFSHRQHPDHPLPAGVHRLVRQASGTLGVGDAVAGALLAQFCVDRRGLWLQVANGVRGIHVNGRPVRRMALLRAGDAVYADGVEMVVQVPPPPFRAPEAPSDHADDMRVLLRGVGGPHHGRSFTLGPARLVGSAREADIHIDDPAFPARHARFQRHGDRVVLHGLGPGQGSVVNGVTVRDAILAAGDQVVFGGQHRFVVEFPSAPDSPRFILAEPPLAEPGTAPAQTLVSGSPAPGARLPWLLLAALLLAAGLSALLWFGAR
ncbi:FHA domain-containing protein [Pseudoxanthomonas koreensis]|uniref:FHA domain-containing protein n=1 Tax=Pseudoxanthomonas koreensis TaxID=266061 RepID=UPI0035A64257